MALWTQADVDALAAAVASGVLQVRFDGPPGRSVTYQSLSEMRAVLADMQRAVARASGKGQPYVRIATSKGF